eukprot:7186441-Pyramimonas_sp.AAC.1
MEEGEKRIRSYPATFRCAFFNNGLRLPTPARPIPTPSMYQYRLQFPLLHFHPAAIDFDL